MESIERNRLPQLAFRYRPDDEIWDDQSDDGDTTPSWDSKKEALTTKPYNVQDDDNDDYSKRARWCSGNCKEPDSVSRRIYRLLDICHGCPLYNQVKAKHHIQLGQQHSLASSQLNERLEVKQHH